VQVVISARHGHISEEHQQQIREKAEKLLHFFERLISIQVIVDLATPEQNKVEILAEAEHRHEFVGHDQGEDLLVAVGHAIDKVKQQLKHHKERIQDHRRDPSHGGTGGIKP